ncbi:ABC transporter ATP-binding protein [bacterium]|nr:ABC transporter ATP-binding protein [bacterium]
MRLELDGVEKSFDGKTVLSGVTLTVADGELACLLGPSGCGKTTALRLLAGFEQIDAGSIRGGGQILADTQTHVPAQRRNIGMVFQEHALLPHLSVAANVALGLRSMDAKARAERVDETLSLVGLTAWRDRYPAQLSGGQSQRVALARSLAPRPKALLLDEPFSNLDVTLKEHLLYEVRDILRQAGMTALLVTHDQHEAFALADKVGVINAGAIQQWATPYDLYHRPANRFVAGFVGEGVLLAGQRDADGRVTTELGLLRGEQVGTEDKEVDVLLRPDDIIHDDASPLCATVVRKAFRGAQILYTLELASGARVLSLVPSHHNHRMHEPIGIRLATDHVVAFARHRVERG